MPLANSITPKKINRLGVFRISFSVILTAFILPAFGQDNSPYTRYGLGDIVPSTNINSRAMGGISAGYNDLLGINFNNPASYGSFQAVKELKSNKIRSGRAILDVGLNFENRTLVDPSRTTNFTASNALFSHLQVGVPLSNTWGLSFGLRPVTRISYKIFKNERLYDPNTGLPIDSTSTLNEGDGGAYLPSIGLGHKFVFNSHNSLSIGANAGYLFGKKDYSTRRAFINDTVEYMAGNYQTKTTFGNFYYNLGLQYTAQIDSSLILTIGAFGNTGRTLNASQDLIRETYIYNSSTGNVRIDSVFEQNGQKGKIEYPSSYTAGFTLQRIPQNQKGGWLIGVDYSRTKWSEYRYYGQVDSVQDEWKLRVGGELRPSLSAGRKSYFGNVTYRAGFFFGPDYIRVREKLPVWGATFGLGLPLRNFNRQTPWQATIINLAFEYIKRGNDKNLLRENLFRVSVGFSLSDFWFIKKQYE